MSHARITAATAGTSVHPIVYDMGVDSGRQFPVGLQGRSGAEKIRKVAAAYAVAFLFGIDAPTRSAILRVKYRD